MLSDQKRSLLSVNFHLFLSINPRARKQEIAYTSLLIFYCFISAVPGWNLNAFIRFWYGDVCDPIVLSIKRNGSVRFLGRQQQQSNVQKQKRKTSSQFEYQCNASKYKGVPMRASKHHRTYNFHMSFDLERMIGAPPNTPHQRNSEDIWLRWFGDEDRRRNLVLHQSNTSMVPGRHITTRLMLVGVAFN